MHFKPFQEASFKNIPGGACHRTPLEGAKKCSRLCLARKIFLSLSTEMSRLGLYV